MQTFFYQNYKCGNFTCCFTEDGALATLAARLCFLSIIHLRRYCHCKAAHFNDLAILLLNLISGWKDSSFACLCGARWSQSRICWRVSRPRKTGHHHFNSKCFCLVWMKENTTWLTYVIVNCQQNHEGSCVTKPMQVLRIMLHVNRRRKLRILTSIHRSCKSKHPRANILRQAWLISNIPIQAFQIQLVQVFYRH